MDANGTIRFVLGFPKTICFVRAKGSYFSQRCALYTLNCMELSGSASKEVATHTFQKRVRLHKSVMACSKVWLLCPLPSSKCLAMMSVFSNPSGRRFKATRDVTWQVVLGRGREHSKRKYK